MGKGILFCQSETKYITNNEIDEIFIFEIAVI